MPKFPNLCPSSNSYVLVVNSPAAFSALVTGLFPCHAPVTRGIHLLWPSIGKVMILTGKLKPGHTHTHTKSVHVLPKCPMDSPTSVLITFHFQSPSFFILRDLGLQSLSPARLKEFGNFKWFQVISESISVVFSASFSWEHLTLWAAQLIKPPNSWWGQLLTWEELQDSQIKCEDQPN